MVKGGAGGREDDNVPFLSHTGSGEYGLPKIILHHDDGMAFFIPCIADDGCPDLLCGVPGEDQDLYVLLDLGPQIVKGNLFDIAACDQNDLLFEGTQAGNGTGGAGGDRVVVVPHPLEGCAPTQCGAPRRGRSPLCAG